MKPAQIDFIENKCWQLIWSAAVLCVLGLTGILVGQWWQVNRSAREVSSRLVIEQERLQHLRVPLLTPADPRYASAEQAARLLQQDLNKAFATVESLQEPGVRLRNLNLEVASNVLRLEYELDSMAKASSITTTLNAGYESRPWQLESVSAVGGNPQVGVVASAQAVRGIWSGQLGKL